MTKRHDMKAVETESDYGKALIRIDYLMSEEKLSENEVKELSKLGYLVNSHE